MIRNNNIHGTSPGCNVGIGKLIDKIRKEKKTTKMKRKKYGNYTFLFFFLLSCIDGEAEMGL